jgi:hypothetical protein
LAKLAADAGCERPDALISRRTFGAVHVGPVEQTGRMPGKNNATPELVTAEVDPEEVVGEVGVIRYHCTFAYGLGVLLRDELTVPVVLAVKILP